jgi:hypothetical protein
VNSGFPAPRPAGHGAGGLPPRRHHNRRPSLLAVLSPPVSSRVFMCRNEPTRPSSSDRRTCIRCSDVRLPAQVRLRGPPLSPLPSSNLPTLSESESDVLFSVLCLLSQSDRPPCVQQPSDGTLQGWTTRRRRSRGPCCPCSSVRCRRHHSRWGSAQVLRHRGCSSGRLL